CFLDFLRVEAAYERDAWNLMPFNIAHEQLSLQRQHTAAFLWEAVFREKNRQRASEHLKRLKRLEKKHGMHLPALTDRIEERFVKPFAVNRMVALIPQSIEDARHNVQHSHSFDVLEGEIEAYLNSTSGSGIDVAPWLRTLEKEVDQATDHTETAPNHSEFSPLPLAASVSLRSMERQLRIWGHEPNRKPAKS
ncbi:MAG: hypothetical protein KDA84_08745, partial [Planctomycetaceae bacterium]|nr:hypothetical protein [Planctomycetaceae bacterium]